jgi:hypothetical protein
MCKAYVYVTKTVEICITSVSSGTKQLTFLTVTALRTQLESKYWGMLCVRLV